MAARDVDVGWGQVLQALMISLMVVVADESGDLRVEITGKETAFQHNAVLGGLVLTFDLT